MASIHLICLALHHVSPCQRLISKVGDTEVIIGDAISRHRINGADTSKPTGLVGWGQREVEESTHNDS